MKLLDRLLTDKRNKRQIESLIYALKKQLEELGSSISSNEECLLREDLSEFFKGQARGHINVMKNYRRMNQDILKALESLDLSIYNIED